MLTTEEAVNIPSVLDVTSDSSPEVNVSICEHLRWNVRHRVVTTKL